MNAILTSTSLVEAITRFSFRLGLIFLIPLILCICIEVLFSIFVVVRRANHHLVSNTSKVWDKFHSYHKDGRLRRQLPGVTMWLLYTAVVMACYVV